MDHFERVLREIKEVKVQGAAQIARSAVMALKVRHDKQAVRLLVVGYGFNDDHLQTHLVKRVQDGTPTLILNRSASAKVEKLAEESPRCVCLSKPTAWAGVAMVTKGHRFEHQGHDLWDLGVLAKELLT